MSIGSSGHVRIGQLNQLLTGQRQLQPDTEGAIRADKHLSRDAKRQLVGLVRLLRADEVRYPSER